VRDPLVENVCSTSGFYFFFYEEITCFAVENGHPREIRVIVNIPKRTEIYVQLTIYSSMVIKIILIRVLYIFIFSNVRPRFEPIINIVYDHVI